MLTRAVEAYRTKDLELAKSPIREDHFLDDLKLLVTKKYIEQIWMSLSSSSAVT
jgi:phosphate uptake regulator